MSQWVAGNGSDLPDGTWAWIRWNAPRAEHGYGMTVSYRREGGWGSNGETKDYWEEPSFPDDGDGRFGWLSQLAHQERSPGTKYEPTVVTHYMIIPEPAPPEDAGTPPLPV